MINTGSPISDLDIKRLEKKCKLSLPQGYREFLLKFNGGHCDPDFFPIHGLKGNSIGHIQLFFGINHPIESCRPEWNYQTFLGRMPNGFFPIACEDGGNIICISLFGDSEGKVFYWDHNGETYPPSFDNVYKIADSFDGFLKSIHSHMETAPPALPVVGGF